MTMSTKKLHRLLSNKNTVSWSLDKEFIFVSGRWLSVNWLWFPASIGLAMINKSFWFMATLKTILSRRWRPLILYSMKFKKSFIESSAKCIIRSKFLCITELQGLLRFIPNSFWVTSWEKYIRLNTALKLSRNQQRSSLNLDTLKNGFKADFLTLTISCFSTNIVAGPSTMSISTTYFLGFSKITSLKKSIWAIQKFTVIFLNRWELSMRISWTSSRRNTNVTEVTICTVHIILLLCLFFTIWFDLSPSVPSVNVDLYRPRNAKRSLRSCW